MKKYIAGFIAGLILAVGGVAVASIPDSGGVIHACIKSNSMVRIIDSASQTCASGETAITWNQTGPQGDTGATGATGPQGPSGGTYGRGFTTFQDHYHAGSGTMAMPSAGKVSLATSPNSQYVTNGDEWNNVTEVWVAELDAEGYDEEIFATEQQNLGGLGILSITLDPDHYVLFEVTETLPISGGTELRVHYLNHVGHLTPSGTDAGVAQGSLVTLEMIPTT